MRYFTFFIFNFCLFFVEADALSKNLEEPMQFQDVLRVVYVSNPSLLAAREELKETRELYFQARAGWLPTITGDASIFATDIESSNFNQGTGATTKQVTLSVNQPIWRGGQTFSEVQRAKKLIFSGAAIVRQAEQDIIQNALEVTMNLIRDQRLLELREENETILIKEFKAVLERREMGDTTQTDVEQTKTRLSSAKALHARAKSNYHISLAAFEEVVGIDAPRDLVMPQTYQHIPNALDEMLKLVEEQNPGLQARIFQQMASEHSVDSEMRKLLPQVFAFASINRQRDPQPGVVSESETDTIGLRASIALYEGGATRSRIRAAKYAAKRQEYNVEDTRRNIRRQVIDAYRTLEAAKAQTHSHLEQIEAAEGALEGVRIEARAGQRKVLDVLDADEELIEAQVAHTRVQRDEVVASYALANLLGLLTFNPSSVEQGGL